MPRYHEAVVEHAPLGVAVCDPDGTIRALNRKAEEVIRDQGMPTPGGLRGRSWREALPRLSQTAFDPAFDDIAAAEPGTTRRLPLVGSRGAYQAVLLRLDHGVAVYFLDGEEVRQSAEELEAARRRVEDDALSFQAFQESYPFGSIAILGPGHRYISVSGRGWRKLRIDPRGLQGKTFEELWDETTARDLGELADVALAGFEAGQRIPFRGRSYEVWAGPLPAVDGEPRGMFLSRDVTEEESRGERVALLEVATDAAEMGIVLVDLQGEGHPIVYASAGFERLTGYGAQEVRGKNCRFLQGDSTDPVTLQRIRSAIERREPLQTTLLNYRKDGSPFWNRLSLTPFAPSGEEATHYIGVQEDVSEIREAQVERNHQRRLAELGTLAGSVAHDFNNILMEIQGRLTLTGESESLDDIEEELAGIEAAAANGRQLVEHLLAYARRNAPEEGPVEGGGRVSEVIDAVTRLLPGSVQVRFLEPEGELVLPLDVMRLEQVLLNLAKNASEAMPGGGTLTVSLERDPEAEQAVLSVSDDGIGMPEEVRERAFDSFYTTKGSGGTGLGLSSVRRIVEQVGGSVHLASERGSGTTFTIVLPLAQTPPTEGKTAEEDPVWGAPGPDADSLVGLRLLLVEDQDGVREVLHRLLERHGMEVTAVADGAAALERYESEGADFDIVLTDWDMPSMGGDHLLHEIDALHPDGGRPWLALMSGDIGGGEGLPAGTILIPKPFEVDELTATLERALAARDEGVA